MSEVQKPVEETVAVPAAESAPAPAPVPAVEVPATEPVAVAETAAPEETPVVASTESAESATKDAPAAEEAVVEPVKEEVVPIEEGILGYKGPGILKSFVFSKKYFFFGSEPVEAKHLSVYLRGEKPQLANNNVAWAASTGKGLLFFSKKASEKSSPAGIINLADASEVTADGTVDFYFSVAGQKHTFQAGRAADRDNWVSQFNIKIAEAKESAESVKESEAYKTALTALSPAPVVAPVVAPAAAAATEDKEIKDDAAEDKEAKKEEAAEVKEEKKEEKKTRKDRSASRKRASIFGAIPGFGKKEEKVEQPKEEVVEPAAEEVAPTTEIIEGAAPAVEETAVVATSEAPVADEVNTAAATAVVSERPAPSKRSSIFGTLSSRFGSKKEKSFDSEAPVVPAKDDETVVADAAPVIPSLEAEAPVAEGVAPAAEVPENKVETPTVKAEKEKRKTFNFPSKKEKSTPSDEEGEKPLSPFAKLRTTLRGKKAEKSSEKAAETPVTEETAATEEPVAAKQEVAAPAPVAAPAVEPVAVAPTPTLGTTVPA